MSLSVSRGRKNERLRDVAERCGRPLLGTKGRAEARARARYRPELSATLAPLSSGAPAVRLSGAARNFIFIARRELFCERKNIKRRAWCERAPSVRYDARWGWVIQLLFASGWWMNVRAWFRRDLYILLNGPPGFICIKGRPSSPRALRKR